MRGKVRMYKGNLAMDRITPAYAGKSEYFNVKQIITKDHPRLCGEKQLSQAYTDAKIGSPPPMRGKGLADETREYRTRITPAYAGKS